MTQRTFKFDEVQSDPLFQFLRDHYDLRVKYFKPFDRLILPFQIYTTPQSDPCLEATFNLMDSQELFLLTTDTIGHKGEEFLNYLRSDYYVTRIDLERVESLFREIVPASWFKIAFPRNRSAFFLAILFISTSMIDSLKKLSTKHQLTGLVNALNVEYFLYEMKEYSDIHWNISMERQHVSYKNRSLVSNYIDLIYQYLKEQAELIRLN